MTGFREVPHIRGPQWVELPLDPGDAILTMEDARVYGLPSAPHNVGGEAIVFTRANRCFWVTGIPSNTSVLEVPDLMELLKP